MTPPPSKNLCLCGNPYKGPSKNPSKKHLLLENLLRTLLRSVRLHDPLGVRSVGAAQSRARETRNLDPAKAPTKVSMKAPTRAPTSVPMRVPTHVDFLSLLCGLPTKGPTKVSTEVPTQVCPLKRSDFTSSVVRRSSCPHSGNTSGKKKANKPKNKFRIITRGVP